MLSTTIIKTTHTQFVILSSARLFHIFNRKHNLDLKHCQQYIRTKVTGQSSYSEISASSTLNKTSQQSTSIRSDKSKKERTTSILQCRLIEPDEFTNEFEDLVFRRFILEEPMDKYLGITKPDECIMDFLQQVLRRAKADRVSLGIYDDSNNHHQQQCIDEIKTTTSVKRDDTQHSSHLSLISKQKLPVCFIINHIENADDPPEKNNFEMDLSKSPIENQHRYKSIGDILSKIMEDLDLFEEYKARRIMQSFLAGIEPEYAHQGLFTRLKFATIELARANKCDLIYSKATSQFSTQANLKLGFNKVRAINYSTYENNQGQRVFRGMSNIHQDCTLTVKDLRV